MAAYAKQAKNKDLEADAVKFACGPPGGWISYAKLRRKHRPKRRHTRKPLKGARFNEKPTLASQGIDKKCQPSSEVGALPDDRFETAVAEARDRVTNALGNAIKRQQREMLADELRRGNRPLPKGKYAAVYADPAWKWKPRSERVNTTRNSITPPKNWRSRRSRVAISRPMIAFCFCGQ